MELSTRNQLFSAILGGVVSGARAKEGASLRDVIRQCWRITDQSLYFSDRLETEQQIAKRWIDKGFVILDTETTGLGFDDEIVEISIIDCAGYVLLNTLVKPSKSIPEAAGFEAVRVNAPRSIGAAATCQKTAAELILKSPLDSIVVACA